MKNLTQMNKEQAATMIPYPPTLATATAGGELTNRTGYPARIAENSFTQGAAGGENSVTRPADNPHGENVTGGARNGDMVTQQGKFYLPGGYCRICDQCGREYTAKRDTSRFCSNACRTAAHRKRHGDGEAGGGRAVVFVVLALIALAWFLWPSLQAARAALAGQAGGLTLINQAGYTAVSPLSNGVVIDTAVSPIVTDQAQGQGQGETAVSLPDLMATVEALAAPETAVSPIVIPTQTAVSPIVTDQGQAETAVSPETIEFWRICADGQAARRRVNPRCPSNAAAALAGLQGQGR